MQEHKYIVTYRDMEKNTTIERYTLDYRPTVSGLRARMQGVRPVECTVEHSFDGIYPTGLQKFEGTNYGNFHDVTLEHITGNTYAAN
jgi:hypothetical protein